MLRFPEPFVQMTIPRLDDYDEEGEEEGVEQNANLTNVEPSANIANLVPFPEAGEYLAHVQMVEDQVEAWDDAGRPAKLAKVENLEKLDFSQNFMGSFLTFFFQFSKSSGFCFGRFGVHKWVHSAGFGQTSCRSRHSHPIHHQSVAAKF